MENFTRIAISMTAICSNDDGSYKEWSIPTIDVADQLEVRAEGIQLNLSKDDLDALRSIDTPSMCNAIEHLRPVRTAFGFTTKPLLCIFPELKPIVGYARTATISSIHPSGRAVEEETAVNLAYYRHMAEEPRPSIAVIEDIDPLPGFGAWWGEVHTNMHKGLGSVGVVTNGSIRDIEQSAKEYQLIAGSVSPSHGFCHCVDWGKPVTVAGMRVCPGDIIHADRHGAVVVPANIVKAMPETVAKLAKEVSIMIGASKRSDFSCDVIERIMKGTTQH